MRPRITLGVLLLSVATAAPAQSPVNATDFAGLARYSQDNARLPATDMGRVVFLGNSITEGWARHFAAMFPGKPYVGRGISGQTTAQMLLRFRQDVIALRPRAVVILAGTNDLAGNTGPATLEEIRDNLFGMADLARANGIRVVLCSILPVNDYPWRPGLQPAPKIVTLNSWLKRYADSTGAVYVDLHGATRDGRDGMKGEYAYDGVHPTEAGYRLMSTLVQQGIDTALKR